MREKTISSQLPRILGVAALMLLSLNETAGAKPTAPSVVADIVTTYVFAGGRKVTTQGRLYRSQDGRVREDSAVGAMITDLKMGTVTLLNLQLKEAVVLTMPPSKGVVAKAPKPDKHGQISKGVHAGRAVTKTHFVLPDGAKQEEWTAHDLGLVVWSRIETPDMTTTRELKNILKVEPDRAVFDIPRSYQVSRNVVPPSAGTAQFPLTIPKPPQ